MKILVKMIGPFIYDAGFNEKDFEFSNPLSVEELLSELHLKQGRPKIIVRNGHGIGLKDQIADGDRIVIAPIYSGG